MPRCHAIATTLRVPSYVVGTVRATIPMVQCLNDVNYAGPASLLRSLVLGMVLDESYCPHVLVLDGYLSTTHVSQSQRATT